jgi:hypothetical protein
MTSFNPSIWFNRTHSSATKNVKSFVGPNTKKSARSINEEVVKSGQLSCKERTPYSPIEFVLNMRRDARTASSSASNIYDD